MNHRHIPCHRFNLFQYAEGVRGEARGVGKGRRKEGAGPAASGGANAGETGGEK